MKKILFILTVLLCTVSCTKTTVSPTAVTPPVTTLSLPDLLVSTEWLQGNDIMTFNTNKSFSRLYFNDNKFVTGTYTATNTTLILNYPNNTSVYTNVTITPGQDSIYIDINSTNKNILFLTKKP